ncbi:beta-ketoacyl synthase N-terminal-like domain-containing protein [Streptomyces sp. ZAF1911]|uniref:beta-ketoacyl synthase N-terminal-like domain-containing protein n=1 Tax=Streptomyces sp. ZAF1911 TaxID=2944129 RepID=UPI00237AF2C2|nr:beta-ketoacyl synthase N-terminal-like domain-containing protein [Streptomyces sp. ZAF1911]MDD9377561.1 beta-ketoacyl synthase N-terminal-like domain-containing protein [Streptomyces sp. ZAF1911]
MTVTTATTATTATTEERKVTVVEPLYVASAGVVSAAGLGLDALAERLLGGGESHDEPVGEDAAAYPPRPVRAVRGLDVKEHLGRKGTKYLDRLTSFGLISCKAVLEGIEVDGARTGVVLATNTGSVSTHSTLLHDTLTLEKPYLVNPGRFPNTVMNSTTGQIAIRNGLRGLNATVAGGQTASLLAFRHARLALSLGRADRLLVGGVEELSAPAAWAWHRTGVLREGAALGEGAAVFTVQPDRPAGGELAELLACESRFTPDPRDYADGLAFAVSRALERSGVEPGEIDVVSLGAVHQRGLEAVERRGVRVALGGAPSATLRIADALGETYSASGSMQLAGLLALWKAQPPITPVTALITSVGWDGNAAALVVRSPR